jgi:hypothetical protein
MFNPTRRLAANFLGSPRRPPRCLASSQAEALELRALLSPVPAADPVVRPAIDLAPLISPPSLVPITPALVRSVYGVDRISFLAGYISARPGLVRT